MEFKIVLSIRAHHEIDEAISYYQFHSLSAPLSFIKELERTYKILAQNPYFAVKYKNIRALKIRKFPYSLFFVINEENNTVKILACFHTKRNPQNLPDK